MNRNEETLQSQLQKLIDLDIPHRLEPEQRLCLAVLRQAVLDYFGDNPLQKQSAADYFAGSPMYQLTLQMFRLPSNLLPTGVGIGREPEETAEDPVDLLQLETLVHELSGSQLKVMLTMGLLELPATAGKISKQCRLNRATVLSALAHLAEEGLVEAIDTGLYTIWDVPIPARQFLDTLWEAAGREATPAPDESAPS